jgi:hypothetical protein
MKKITFKPPYRVGRKSGETVLDSNGNLVVNFRDREKAQEYANFLNEKEADKIISKRMPIWDEVARLELPLKTRGIKYQRRPNFWETIKRFFGWEPKVVPVPVNNFKEWNVNEVAIAVLINRMRGQYAQKNSKVIQIKQLTPNELLWQEARKRCQVLADTGSISHDGVGVAFGAIAQAGYKSPGEIVAYQYRSPESVVKAWLNSSNHAKIIYSSTPTYFGVANLTIKGKYYYCVLFCK